ncbi:Hsp33 family molecular chaperone HslO [Govanella unica]|uniref:Hsp33 family molecular chaperone HslO n=1 Tax=Govanella unica TaxID=2975056 RepID=A0A9X3Z821_9PROT|nr:Hsp33 family molecular chaperone HslO [Govania unica]MDA5194792.1 Hsp33 family molecular chaperone HslO [Govania unica]
MSEQSDALTFSDVVVPFVLEKRGVNGRVTRLDAVVDTILTRHDYPRTVSTLLGEALAITALLGSLMKFEGIFTLQAKGDGPVSLLVCDFVTAPGSDGAVSIGGTLRGYAKYDVEKLAALSDGSHDLKTLMGGGYLAFTLDQGDFTDRYQGIVDLDGQSLDDCARAYFRNSEQIAADIKTRCALVSGAHGMHWRAGSLLVRHLPAIGGDIDPATAHTEEERLENWDYARAMLTSLRAEELLDPRLSLHDLLYRLYHDDDTRVYSPSHLTFGCRCSEQRLALVIGSFPPEERIEMAKDGEITATCEFCKTDYKFKLADFM